MSILILFSLSALLCFCFIRYPAIFATISYIWWKIKIVKNHSKGYAVVSDTRIYFEVYGNGRPVLLLHGGLTSVESWFGQLPALAKSFKVYALDMRGHGRSTLGNQTFTYRLLADDVAQVLDHLRISNLDVVGWSDGGNVGLSLAINYPARINRLVAISANYHPSGLTTDTLKNIEEATPASHSFFSRLIYRLIAPDPHNWDVLWHKVTTMWANYPQLNRSDLEKIITPTLLIQGENDLIHKDHFLEMVESIPNTELQIIPNVGHNVLQEAPGTIADAIKNFLT